MVGSALASKDLVKLGSTFAIGVMRWLGPLTKPPMRLTCAAANSPSSLPPELATHGAYKTPALPTRMVRRMRLALSHKQILIAICPLASVIGAQQPAPRTLRPNDQLDTTLMHASVHTYVLPLHRGESANVIVTQMGVDVVVETLSPEGTVIGSVDSPNGRNGDEPVELIASRDGDYRIRVRPFDANEPQGRYHLQVVAWRDAAATTVLLEKRRLARVAAATWLRARSDQIPESGNLSSSGSYASLDKLARRVRVLGIGEATHGSREFTDFRLAFTRRLIERFGYRAVAIEGSTDKLAQLNEIASGHRSAASVAALASEAGWIGERSRIELTHWLMAWNAAHPSDRARIVGVDPQITQAPQRWVSSFLVRAYGAEAGAHWAPIARELAAADSQVLVFGNSDVHGSAHHALFELMTRLQLDAPLLSVRLGSATVDSARAYVGQLVEFADFNAGDDSTIIRNHSRDWYMAARVLTALSELRPREKVVYWAHNAHVYAPSGRQFGARSAGLELRDALGCAYGALGMTFGEGGFLSQIPNDLEDRLHLSELPAASEESVDAVLGAVRPGASAFTWDCGGDRESAPEWLRQLHPMHWVGGLFAPESAAASAFRPYAILRDFDGAVYFPRVTSEPLPPKRPMIPARPR